MQKQHVTHTSRETSTLPGAQIGMYLFVIRGRVRRESRDHLIGAQRAFARVTLQILVQRITRIELTKPRQITLRITRGFVSWR